MSFRVVAISLLAAAVLAPCAMAQTPNEVSVTISGVPTAVQLANETSQSYRLTVALTVNNLVCAYAPTSGPKVVVTLASAVSDNPKGSVTAETPSTLEFGLPSIAQSYSTSNPADLRVSSKAGGAANITVSGTYAVTGCQGAMGAAPAGGTIAAQSFGITFPASKNNSPVATAPAEEPVPGLELPLLAAAVVALALVIRRRKA